MSSIQSATQINQATDTRIAGFPARMTPCRFNRPPLLFLHGAFVTHLSYVDWQDCLSNLGWGGWAASWRGRLGIPPEGAKGVSIADYIADARKMVEALPERPVVIAHSLGGLVAQKLLEENMVVAAVLMAPAPAGMLTAQPVALRSYLPMLPSILAGRSFLPPAGTCSRIVLNEVPKNLHAAIHNSLIPESGRVYREMMSGAIRIDAGKVRAPVLVLSGDRDRIISTGLARATARRLKADFRILPGRGHMLFAEPGWQDVAGEVAKWLDAKVGAATR
jgi:pimeloyl-ACP methyl ester carboxylesterase